MDQSNRIKYRCPVCFSRENDVVLLKSEKGYYCVKCSFNGSLEDVQGMYEVMKKKYRLIRSRLTLKDQRNL